MKFILATIVVVSSVKSLIAQVEVAAVPVKKSVITEMQTFIVGDSVLIGYKEQIDGNYPVQRYRFISGDGTVTPFVINSALHADLLHVSAVQDNLYFYFIEEKSGSVTLHGLILYKKAKRFAPSQPIVEFSDPIAGVFVENDLHIVTSSKSKSEVTITRVHKMETDQAVSIPVPATFFDFKARSVALIQEGIEAQPWQAEARLKLYVSKNRMRISLDKPSAGTTVLDADLSTIPVRTRLREFPEKSAKQFSSFLFDEKLYRVVRDMGITVSVYDTAGAILSSHTVNQNSLFSKRSAYLCASDSWRTLQNRTVWDAIDNDGAPFISASRLETNNVILKIGTHRELRRINATPIVPSSGPLGLRTSLKSKTSATSLERWLGCSDLYFYEIGNAVEGFKYWDGNDILNFGTSFIGREIDAYEEFDLKQHRIDYFFKSYAATKEFTVGVYREENDPEVIMVMKYPKAVAK